MFKRFKNLFLVMAILGLIFANSYSSELKEVKAIEEYSAQVLGEEEEEDDFVDPGPDPDAGAFDAGSSSSSDYSSYSSSDYSGGGDSGGGVSGGSSD